MPKRSKGRRGGGGWPVLFGVCLGVFALFLDSTVVSLALSEIRKDLGTSAAELQWVMNIYLLVLAVSVVTLGRLGDMFGRRRFYVIGGLTFAAGSMMSALAPTPEMLIAGRAVQGLGSAAVLAQSLALISAAFPPRKRTVAYGIWAGISTIGLAVGPLIGGALAASDWRLIFWINLPFCILGAVTVRLLASESTDKGADTRIDWPGLITLTLGLGSVVFALINADEWGWVDARTLALLAAGVLLIAGFVRVERSSSHPIVQLDLFNNKPYLGASLAAFVTIGAFWPVMFYIPQYIQDVLDYSPVEAGLLVLPVTAPTVLISPLCARLMARLGARVLMGAGMVCGLIGVILLTRIEPGAGYEILAPGLLLFGVALGLIYAPMSAAAMAAMPDSKAGIASGVLAMNRMIAGAVGLAIVGSLFTTLRSDDLANGMSAADSFARALGDSLWYVAALLLVGLVATSRLLPGREQRAGGGKKAEARHKHRFEHHPHPLHHA